MSTVAERFNLILEKTGKTQSDVARAINASPTAITKIATGETKRSRLLGKISEYLGVSEAWLVFGDESNGDKIDAEVRVWDNSTPMPSGMIAVPYFKDLSLSAGSGALNSDLPHTGNVLWFSKSFLRRQGACPDSVFCITVKGDSMEPRYDEGGIVVIDATQPISVVDGKTYAIHYQGQDYIKYLRRMPDNKILISSENQVYRPFEAIMDEVKIIGRVIAYQREE